MLFLLICQRKKHDFLTNFIRVCVYGCLMIMGLQINDLFIGVMLFLGALMFLWGLLIVALREEGKGMINVSRKLNAGLYEKNIVYMKELSTCDRCKQPVNIYVMIWPLQMQVCEKCYSHINMWGNMILKRLLGYAVGVGV